ncbi:hypothetical protein PIB30_094695, partial [Stylosanthes scabra]|nr:hypothetical protein [Stylosanthes scabra]
LPSKVFVSTGLFISEMAKKSCQNGRNPRMLSPAERELYGWVDAKVFTQSSVIAHDHLLEILREMRLTQDLASGRDYVLEAVGPSDRLPFQATEDRTHFLWAYVELFTHLGVRLPFSDFQREVLTWCQVAASQLHLNGWGFLRTFERVCLHFGFHPSWHIFLYTYQLHAPPPKNGSLSFRAYQGRRLFDAFEEPIQEFKWHYFKVVPLPGSRPFWLADEGKPFPWVYWNPEARECRITTLDPLETLAFQFLQSLPVGLGKKSNFKCRWIVDHSDAEIGVFLDSLLEDMEKQSRYDRLLQKIAELASGGSSSSPAVPVPAPTTSVPSAPSSTAAKTRGKPSDATAAKPFSMEREEGAKEDLAVDLRQKKRKRKVSEAALGGDSAWKHKVNPIDRTFLSDYKFRAALDAGLKNGPIREILGPLVPEQLLGTTQFLACQLTACL